MSERPGRVLGRLALSACVCVAIAVGPATAAKAIAPFRATVSVRWGAGAGSDAFRDDLSRALAAALATGCFSSVSIAGQQDAAAGGDLDVEVLLSGVVDETRFDDSIAGALQPGEPAKELQRVTHFEVTVDGSLTARATGALVSRKHLVAHVSRRPVYIGEDPQATARAEAIHNIVRDLSRGLGCGSAKLDRKIRDALGDAGQKAPAAR